MLHLALDGTAGGAWRPCRRDAVPRARLSELLPARDGVGAVTPRIAVGPSQKPNSSYSLPFRKFLRRCCLVGAGKWNTHMSKFEQYRRNAEEAKREADRATSDEIRTAWLQLGQGWLALLPKRDLSREQAFNIQAKA